MLSFLSTSDLVLSSRLVNHQLKEISRLHSSYGPVLIIPTVKIPPCFRAGRYPSVRSLHLVGKRTEWPPHLFAYSNLQLQSLRNEYRKGRRGSVYALADHKVTEDEAMSSDFIFLAEGGFSTVFPSLAMLRLSDSFYLQLHLVIPLCRANPTIQTLRLDMYQRNVFDWTAARLSTSESTSMLRSLRITDRSVLYGTDWLSILTGGKFTPNLSQLHLEYCGVHSGSREAFRIVTEGLASTPFLTLEYLRLDGYDNLPTEMPWGQIRDFCSALRKFSQLRRVRICDNPSRPQFVQRLRELLPGISVLGSTTCDDDVDSDNVVSEESVAVELVRM